MENQQPQVGDEWEVKIPGKARKVKTVGRLSLNGLYGDGQPYVHWERRNKGRYTGIRVARLLEFGRRLSTKEERDQHFANIVNARRARLGKPPL